MGQHEADVVIHINETLDEPGLTGLESYFFTDARARSAWHHEAHWTCPGNVESTN